MRIHRPGQDITLEASADLSTHQYKFVKGVAGIAGGQLARVALAGAGDRPLGITQNKPNASGLGSVVRIAGTSKLVVDGSGTAVVAGLPIKASTNGIGVVAGTDKDKVGAIALEPSTVASDVIEVLVVLYDLAV
jgi:hypothetical protein